MRRIKAIDITQISLFVALMVIGAFVKIPNPFFPVVPITLQLFFAVLSGLILGAKKGTISQLIYVALGLIGVPVFAMGGGLQYVFNPTFGFIIGFVLASFLSGLIREKVNNITVPNIYFASFIGLVVVYVVGIVYLFLIKKYVMSSDVSFIPIVMAMLPFIIKDLVLIAVNVIIVPPIIQIVYDLYKTN